MAEKNKKDEKEFVFNKSNYIYLFIGLGLNIIGFLLMIGGADTDPNEFNAKGLFSPVRLTVAPIVIILGYAVIFYSIMKRPKGVKRNQPTALSEDKSLEKEEKN